MTDLEQYGISEDFKQFIPEGIPEEQLDEYKLLNIIQYDLGYTYEDFRDVINMDNGPYYSFIQGQDKVISIYEFYRGRYKIMKKIMSIGADGRIQHETPIVFLDLIKRKSKSPEKIEKAIENLKNMKDETDKIIEELKESYQQEQKGFLYNLYNALLVEREKAKGIENKFRVVMTALQTLPYYLYSKEIKPLLTSKNLIEMNKNNIVVKDFKGVIETLYDFFKEKGLTDIESLKARVSHLGWYYEI